MSILGFVVNALLHDSTNHAQCSLLISLRCVLSLGRCLIELCSLEVDVDCNGVRCLYFLLFVLCNVGLK